ncbi:MAG: NRDE family protein [Akkermansiaceae bacterium]|nr:NRDE family protein [Akkermansiaceae bacterium]
MCTLTWWRESAERFEVFFSRDEKKTRSRAVEPRRCEVEGVRYLSPQDPDAGGTWMVANEQGVVVCLLNRWHDRIDVPEPVRSRGLLVEAMAGMENVPAVEEQLRSEDLTHVQPLTLVVFDRVGERGFDWNGRELKQVKMSMPMCSSSFHFDQVELARKNRFEELFGRVHWEGRDLEKFHADTEGGASAYTIRMCRPDAQTMSRSRVRVEQGRLVWDYWEEQPDFEGLPDAHRIELKR